MEGRHPVRVAGLEEYLRDPKIIAEMGEKPPDTMTLFPFREFNVPHKWGMAIDLTSCTGCNACTIACQAENNIPVVGKDQVVARPRDALDPRRSLLHRRPDREDTAQAVAPAGAVHAVRDRAVRSWSARSPPPTHSSEGLNDMIYNRCVGTRYCSNNCPYKVRRFNFLLYQDWTTPSLEAAAATRT